MKHQLSFTFALCISALVSACGDDTGGTTPTVGDDAGSSSEVTSSEGESSTTPGPGESSETSSAATLTSDPESSAAYPDAGDGAATQSDAGDAGTFVISSPSFGFGEALPNEFTCEAKPFGAGFSPELNWSGAPATTKSFAIVFKDLTLLPADLRGYHWGAWNIPVSVTGIPEHLGIGDQPEELEGGSQFRAGPPHENEFFGPCPSWATFCSGADRKTDHYAFTLYAFDVEEIQLPEPQEGVNYVSLLEQSFIDQTIGIAQLEATSDAAPTEFAYCPPPVDVDAGDAGPVSDVTEGDAAATEGDVTGDASVADGG
jgi:phosphatidylethanolamine-binding protein (PEBP) family uncharacterized protein